MEEIIQLPPLAILLNGVVEALNEIRNCAPTNVVQGAAQALRKTLDAVRRPAPPHRTAARRQPKTVLCTQASRRILGCRLEGGDLWGDLCEVYVTALLPHVVSCFEKLFRGEDRIGTWEARGGRLLALAHPQGLLPANDCHNFFFLWPPLARIHCPPASQLAMAQHWGDSYTSCSVH